MAKAEFNGKKGVWRTVKGRKVFFPDGEDKGKVLKETFGNDYKPSKKRIKNGKWETSDDEGKSWRELKDFEEYDDTEADEEEFDEDIDEDYEDYEVEKNDDWFEELKKKPSTGRFKELEDKAGEIDKALDEKVGMWGEERNLSKTGKQLRDEEMNVLKKDFGLNDDEAKAYLDWKEGNFGSLQAVYEKNEHYKNDPNNLSNKDEVIGGDDNVEGILKDDKPLSEEESKTLDKETNQRNLIEEHNRKVGLESRMHSLIDNAKSKGQSPQQVLDSVSYDMDIQPGSEEYNTLKNLVMYNTRLNKDTGAYEYNRFNQGSNKTLTKAEDILKLKELSDAFKNAGLDNEIEHGYEDFGADMKWHNLTSNGTWVLNPRDWMDYMNGNATKEEIVDRVKNGKYSGAFKWKEPEGSEETEGKQQKLTNTVGKFIESQGSDQDLDEMIIELRKDFSDEDIIKKLAMMFKGTIK